MIVYIDILQRPYTVCPLGGQDEKMNLNLGKRQIRKVNYTRTLSLPKIWLDTVALNVGDWVEMEMTEDGNLLLRPVKEDGSDAPKVQ